MNQTEIVSIWDRNHAIGVRAINNIGLHYFAVDVMKSKTVSMDKLAEMVADVIFSNATRG